MYGLSTEAHEPTNKFVLVTARVVSVPLIHLLQRVLYTARDAP